MYTSFGIVNIVRKIDTAVFLKNCNYRDRVSSNINRPLLTVAHQIVDACAIKDIFTRIEAATCIRGNTVCIKAVDDKV